MRGSTNKSLIKLSMQLKLNDMGDFFLQMGKTTKAKPYWVILRSLLLRIHYYQNKRLQINKTYTNLQLKPYSNTQLDLFCSDSLSFSMHGSQYVTNQLRGS